MGPRDTPRPPRLAVITRLRPDNAGNEALSTILLDYIAANVPHAEIRVVDRNARCLKARLAKPFGPRQSIDAEGFDRFAQRLIMRGASAHGGLLSPRYADAAISVLPRPAGLARFRRYMPPVRTLLTRFGLWGRSDLQRIINTLAWADIVIWQPAGEITPNLFWRDTFYPLMLLRVGQLLGAETMALNQTIEDVAPQLKHILVHVYLGISVATVREAASMDTALRMGVARDRLMVAPDLAFLGRSDQGGGAGDSERDTRCDIPHQAIILGLAAPTAALGFAEWDSLVGGLARLGRPLVFLSNSMAADAPFAHDLAKRHPIIVIERQLGYREMVGVCSTAAIVVASRLHTVLFALCGGVPVVTLEQQQHKISSIIASLGLPVTTEDRGVPGWSSRAVEKAAIALAEKGAMRPAITEAVSAQIRSIDRAYLPIFARIATLR